MFTFGRKQSWLRLVRESYHKRKLACINPLNEIDFQPEASFDQTKKHEGKKRETNEM